MSGPVPQEYSKHFIPLESNPEVFTELSHKLGLDEQLEFQDVLSLDDLYLLSMLPRPVYALILVFPTTDAYEQRVAKEDSGLGTSRDEQHDENIVFFKQTINNACGLYAILHAVCNGGAREWLSRLSAHHSAFPSDPTRKRFDATRHRKRRCQQRD